MPYLYCTCDVYQCITVVLSEMLQGKSPSLIELLDLHNVVVNAEDLRMPIHLSAQLSGSALDKNVKDSMMELLQGPSNRQYVRQNSSFTIGSKSKSRVSLEGADNRLNLTLAMMGATPSQSVRPAFEHQLEVSNAN